jgi:hypothetical protein
MVMSEGMWHRVCVDDYDEWVMVWQQDEEIETAKNTFPLV